MEIFWLYVATLFWPGRLLINKQLLFDFITLSRAFSVGEERGRGELRIHNEYLCLQNVENVAQNVAKRHGEASGASCNSCRQTHQLPKIAIPGVIGVVDGQKGGGREEGERRGTHSQSASQPVVLPLILLTRSSFYATQRQWHKWRLQPACSLLSFCLPPPPL